MLKNLTIIGAALIGIGLLFIVFSFILQKTSLFRLPGDITIEKEGFEFHFPVVSCLLISIVLTLLINLIVYVLSKK